MIFNVPGHIDMIRNGLQEYPSLSPHILPKFYVKTQTRRVNRGIYQVGRDYAVQRKRGVKAEEDIRIVMDDIWEEDMLNRVDASNGLPVTPYIFHYDAKREGCYTPEEYEDEFRKAYPKWDKVSRWVFEFHVIEMSK